MKEINRQAHLGKKHSDATRAKMSASGLQRYIENESPIKGRKNSSEHNSKVSKSMKKFYQNESNREKHSEIIKLWWKQRKLKTK